MQTRLFSPIAGRLIVVNLIAEIRAITREYLVSQFNWVFETSNRPNDLHTVIDDVASWYDNASGFFESLSCMWPFGGPAHRINDLKQLFTIARDIEDFLHQLNDELDKLKDCVSDRNKFESQVEIVLEKKRLLINIIAIHYATLFRQVKMRQNQDFILEREREEINRYEEYLRKTMQISDTCKNPLYCHTFTYIDQKGTQNKIQASGLLDEYSRMSDIAEKILERVLGYHLDSHVYVDLKGQYYHVDRGFDHNQKYDLAKISAAVTHDIDIEISACERQLAAVEQVINAKVEPVRAENFRLTTELATKEHVLTAADTKLKITEAERDSAQQMAASLADRHLADRTSTNNAALTQLTNASADTSHLRSRRIK